jgi:feruloyl esterase
MKFLSGGLSAVIVVGFLASRTAVASTSCESLASLSLKDATITAASTVAAGAFRPPAAGPAGGEAFKSLASFCRVAATLRPSPDSDIKVEVWLPASGWNGKFQAVGNGGWAGTIGYGAMGRALAQGYATSSTDTGHTGGSASFALGHPEKLADYAYRSEHEMTVKAKAIIDAFYGTGPKLSYWNGCSTGGRQALMEAQRYPDDFDGIVAGAPAADFTGIGAQFIKDVRAQFPDPQNLTPLLPPETMKSVAAQILDKCDALDGVKDGVMEDPRQCKVDVSTLTGLSEAQIAALKTIYAPTRAGNETVFPGQPFGGEGELAGWPAWISGAAPRSGQPAAPSLRYAFGTQLFKYIVFNDPEWDYRRYDLSTWKKDTAKAASVLNATSPDLDAFKAKGHKLLLWHGWSDAGLSPLATIKYYESVQARDRKADEYVKMFLMPGVLHCGAGAGPDNADWAAAIDGWVESGKAPSRIIAQKGTGAAVTRTRPLCPYPQHAVYSGTGSTDQAENFVCK